MDIEVEEVVADCQTCAQADKSRITRQAPLMPVEIPKLSWDRLGLDIVGSFDLFKQSERYVIVLMDYATKWIATKCLSVASSNTIIEFLKEEFSREGISTWSETMVSSLHYMKCNSSYLIWVLSISVQPCTILKAMDSLRS